MPRVDRLLFDVGIAHAVVGVVCLGLLLVDATPILGVHPALKPMKFAMSIAAFLVTMALLLPTLSVADGTRRIFAGALSVTMIVEMTIIAVQPLRGRRSHFNLETPLDRVLTTAMMIGIAVLLLVMIAIAIMATVRPLAQPAVIAMAWRAALWIFLFAGISGLAMGGRGGHSVGGVDGGPGMPVTNWSTTHGDLRVSHFFSLHALQILPLLGLLLHSLSLRAGVQWTLLGLGVTANAVLAGWTWFQALASRPLW